VAIGQEKSQLDRGRRSGEVLRHRES
jgi:hypothetical protein